MTCSSQTIPFTATIVKGETLTMYGRITAAGGSGSASPVTEEGNLIKRADVSSISMLSMADGAQVGSTQSLNVATVVYETLQTTGAWANVHLGGNVLLTVPASLLDTANSVAQVKTTFTMVDTTLIVWLIDVTVIQPAS